jgi:hypothetical protein
MESFCWYKDTLSWIVKKAKKRDRRRCTSSYHPHLNVPLQPTQDRVQENEINRECLCGNNYVSLHTHVRVWISMFILDVDTSETDIAWNAYYTTTDSSQNFYGQMTATRTSHFQQARGQSQRARTFLSFWTRTESEGFPRDKPMVLNAGYLKHCDSWDVNWRHRYLRCWLFTISDARRDRIPRRSNHTFRSYEQKMRGVGRAGALNKSCL